MVTYLGDVIEGQGDWEPLISLETFEAVQSRLAEPARRFKGAGTGRKHLGSSLFLCECGSTVRTTSRAYACPHNHYSRSIKPVDELVMAIARERLARPDLATLLARPKDTLRAKELAGQRRRLQARLATVEGDYDAGLIDARRLRSALSRIRAQLQEVAREQAKLVNDETRSGLLTADDPVAAFDMAPLAIQQRVIDALMTVTLKRVPRGTNWFDPRSVQVTPKGGDDA